MDKRPATQQPDLLFEVSWEVCNKIGGIYTVLSTKAKTLQKVNKDKTVFIGPDVWSAENPSPWFTECNVPGLTAWCKKARLPEGIGVRVGRWEIPGRPIAVLVRFDGMYAVKDEFDEWTTGMGLLYVKWKLPEVATVFTTHATSIGRSICGNNKPLYDHLHNYDGDQMARELNMEAKHSLEKAAATQGRNMTMTRSS